MRFSEILLELTQQSGSNSQPQSSARERGGPRISYRERRQQELEAYLDTAPTLKGYAVALGHLFSEAAAGNITARDHWLTRELQSDALPHLIQRFPELEDSSFFYQVIEAISQQPEVMQEPLVAAEVHALLRNQISHELGRQPLFAKPEVNRQHRLAEVLYFIAKHAYRDGHPITYRPLPSQLEPAWEVGEKVTTLFIKILAELAVIMTDEKHPAAQDALDIISLLNEFQVKMMHPESNARSLFTPYWVGLLAQEDTFNGLKLQEFLVNLACSTNKPSRNQRKHIILYEQIMDTLFENDYQVALLSSDIKDMFTHLHQYKTPKTKLRQSVTALLARTKFFADDNPVHFKDRDPRDPTYQQLFLRYAQYRISFWTKRSEDPETDTTIHFHLTVFDNEFIDEFKNDELPSLAKLAFSVVITSNDVIVQSALFDPENFSAQHKNHLLGIADTLIRAYLTQMNEVPRPNEEQLDT